MIFNSESVLYNLKSGKYLPFLRRYALKARDRFRKFKTPAVKIPQLQKSIN